MLRAFALTVLLLFGSIQSEGQAQNVPVASAIRLEDLLMEIGDRFGIVIVSAEPLDELIAVRNPDESAPAMLGSVLARYSYLLIYSGKWSGPLAASPNYLEIFSRESGGIAQVLNKPSEDVTQSGVVDAIAHVDDIFESVGHDSAQLAAALARVVATADDATVREEAIYALARIDTQFSRDVLVQALGDDSPEVREAVVIAIADSAYPDPHSVFALALADEHSGVREAADDALNRLD